MGTTPKPLTILVDHRISAWEEFVDLQGQGHRFVGLIELGDTLDLSDIDLILSPIAHRMDDPLRKWLPEAIKEARRRKYPPSKKGAQ